LILAAISLPMRRNCSGCTPVASRAEAPTGYKVLCVLGVLLGVLDVLGVLGVLLGVLGVLLGVLGVFKVCY
jgi:hypothetical protein